MPLVKTQIDQEAAALGAAAVAAVGTGLWRDFSQIDAIHKVKHIACPIPRHVALYEWPLPIFIRAAQHQAELGEMLAALEL